MVQYDGNVAWYEITNVRVRSRLLVSEAISLELAFYSRVGFVFFIFAHPELKVRTN